MLSRSWATRLGRGAVVLTAAFASVVGTALPASAVDEEMKPGEVRVVDAFVPSTPLVRPDDGRLRGYGFSATVDGIAEAAMVEDGIFDFKPPPGHRIVVFAVRSDSHGDTDHARPVRGTVVVDGRRTAVDHSFGGEGPLVAVAVPTDAGQVQFEMAAAALVQTFSLTDRKRVGPQPTVLYRDPDAPEVVTDVNADRVVRAEDDTATSSLTLALRTARLGYFSPGPATGARDAEVVTPSSPEQAFLIVEADADEVGSTFEDFGTVPAADVKVRLADGTLVEGRHAGPSDGLVSGAYWFEVPADTTTASVLIGPANVAAKRRDGDVIQPTRVRIEQATFDLTFPAGSLPAPSEPASGTASTLTTEDGLGRTEPTSEEGDGGFPMWLLALALAVSLAGLVVWQVRRGGHTGAPSRPGDADHSSLDEPVSLLAVTDAPVLEVGGEGALDAVRAAVADADGASVVVLARDETEPLWPTDTPPSSVAMVREDDALLPAVEVAKLRLARLADDQGGDGEEGLAGAEGAAVLVVVPASLDGEVGHALREAAHTQPGTRLLVVGSGPLEVDAAGVVVEGGVATRRVVVSSEPRGEVPREVPSDTAPQPADAQRPVVAVALLGPFRISAGDRQIGTGLRRKSRELLALLAIHRDGLSTDAAMEALWPGEPADDGYLRTVVGNLRTVLRSASGAPESAPVIERVGQHLRLDPASVDVDLWRFEDALAAAARGDDAAAELAVATYRGDLLDGEDFPWSGPARERLRGRALDHLADVAEARHARGDLAGALRAAERAVDLDPYAEELYQRVIGLYRDLGRPDGARRTFDALAAHLRELDAEPSRASRALVDGLGG